MRTGIYIAAVLLVFASCSSKETKFSTERDFQAYINDPENGFIVVQESEDLIFEARLVPPMSGEKSKECTINLRIKRKDGGPVLDFGGADRQMAIEREGYLAFDLKDDVSLSLSGESIPPVFHHYERNYGLKPSVDVLFNFMGLKTSGDAVFKYRDRLFGQGLIKITFDKELFNTCYVAEK